jgi:hypothetical protein
MAAARDIIDRRTAQQMLGIDDGREFDHLLQHGMLAPIDPGDCPQFEGFRRDDVAVLAISIRPRALARWQAKLARAAAGKPTAAEQQRANLARETADSLRRAEERERDVRARLRIAGRPRQPELGFESRHRPRVASPWNPLSYFEQRSAAAPPLPDIPGLASNPDGTSEAPGWTDVRPPTRPIKRPRPDLVRIDEAYGLFDDMPAALINFGVSRGILPTVKIDNNEDGATWWFPLEFVQSMLADPATMKACACHLIDVRDNDRPPRPFTAKPTKPPQEFNADVVAYGELDLIPVTARVTQVTRALAGLDSDERALTTVKGTDGPAPAAVVNAPIAPAPEPTPAVNGLPRRQDARPQPEQPRHGDASREPPRETVRSEPQETPATASPAPPPSLLGKIFQRLKPSSPVVPEPATPQAALDFLFAMRLPVPNNERSVFAWVKDAVGTERRYSAQAILCDHGLAVLHDEASVTLVIAPEHPYLAAIVKDAGWRPQLLTDLLRRLPGVRFGRSYFRHDDKSCRHRGIFIPIEVTAR